MANAACVPVAEPGRAVRGCFRTREETSDPSYSYSSCCPADLPKRNLTHAHGRRAHHLGTVRALGARSRWTTPGACLRHAKTGPVARQNPRAPRSSTHACGHGRFVLQAPSHAHAPAPARDPGRSKATARSECPVPARQVDRPDRNWP